MTYRVSISPTTILEIESVYLQLQQSHPHVAVVWYDGIVNAILSLEKMPKRCGFAYESRMFNVEIRQLLYGKHPNQYRILFTIESDEVQVHHVRHCKQRPLDLDQLPPTFGN